MPFVISKDPIEGDFDSDTESKFVIGGEVTPDGAPIYGEDDILTKAGWRYRKKTTDTDILQGAVQAAKGLWNGFAKIPEVVRSKGLLGAANNIPEGLLAAGEGWADIVKTVASKNYAVVTGMSEEQDLDRQYDNYREVAERSVEQVKRSRSRVGDFFRAIGAPEQAAPYDESIDQETSNALSMVLDPTNLIGGGSLKSMLAAGKGAKVAVAGEKAAVAGEKALQAAEKVSAEVAETTAKVVPPIRDGPAPINWNEPVAKATELAGKGAEKTGRGLQSVADSLVAWEKANPNWATVGSAAIGAASNDENPLTGAFIGAGARTVLPSILKTAPKALVTAGEAAQVAALASREGFDVAAKSGVAGEKVSAIAKRLDTPAVNFLLSQSAQLADAAAKGMVIGGGLGYAVNNDPEVSGLGSGIGAGIVGGPMGRLQSIGIDQAGRVAFHKADADGKWVRVSESPASLAKDQDLAVSFLASRSLPERTVLAERLSVAQLAELARGEAAAKGANRATGEDMDVRFLDTQGMIDAGFDPLVAKGMQGVTETTQKPVLFINLDVARDPAYTLWHETTHGFDKLAPEEKGGKPTQGATDLGNARAELKALYFGTFDAEGNQITKGKYTQEQMLSLEDQYLSRAMNEAEIAAHQKKPMRERAAYIADEMVAEHAGMLGRLSGGDIGKASRYPTTAMGRATLGVLGRAKGALEALGVKFDGGGEVVTSGIFKDPETGKPLSMSSDVREKLSAYLRAKDKITTRLSIDDAHSPVVETVRAADLMKADATPETLARWKDSGIFKLDDKGEILMQGGKLVDGRMMGGKPVLLSKAERERVEANRSAAIFQAIKSAPDDGTPALRSEMVDGVEVFKGKVLGKSQLEAILALPDSIFPASMKERLKKLIEIQADPGSIGIADYYKALTGGKYDTKASMSVMVFVPVSFKVSAAGNLRVTTFSVVGFEDKLTQWGKTKKGFFDLWEGNKEAFRNDVLTYLENQGTPEGNVALTKEAIAKKDAINDFIKPFFAGDTDRVTTKSGRDNMIRSPRVDRMASVSRGVGDKMPYDYGKVLRNFMPAEEEPSAPFYSRLNRTVEQSQQNKASGAQWKATIKNSKLGANADEMALVGVGDLEDGKTYSKQEVLDYLRANEVVVKDVTLGGVEKPEVRFDSDLKLWRLYREGKARGGFDTKKEADDFVAEGLHEFADKRETHFSSYQLPGAVEGSYREVLLTVPEGKTRREKLDDVSAKSNRLLAGRSVAQLTETERAAYSVLEGEFNKIADDTNESGGWDDGHSQYRDIANPIVRLRHNERTTSDGKRMLFLEEVQAPQKAEFEKMPALFQKNWREIAFKYALRKASEEGYDSVGWTTGEQQAARYDLSKHIDHLTYLLDANILFGKKGKRFVIDEKIVAPDKLHEIIGKEAADRLLNNPTGVFKSNGAHYLSGLDLKVGGEGLKKLYDTDFRNVVNNLPAVKKLGQKVGVAVISNMSPAVIRNGKALAPADVHSIDLTPAIRESVMGGQARFQPADADYLAAVKSGDIATAQRMVYEVGNGAGHSIKAHHGTSRGDRVGNRFNPKRATSGPMAFFTDKRDIAESYAKGKQDTSLEMPEDYRDWFKVKRPGVKGETNLTGAWAYLSPEQKAGITAKLYTTGYENPREASGPIVGNSQSIMDKGGVDYELRSAKGNALEAAKEIWLNSGSLFGSELEFLDVLKGLGLEGARLDDPNAKNPKVYDVLLRIKNPFVTSDITPEQVAELNRASLRARKPVEKYGADSWDKTTISPADWMAALREDIASGRSHVWTRIPDWVTKSLRGMGFDGISDTGGKMGGVGHNVWIPFDPSQIKSADPITRDSQGNVIPLSQRFNTQSEDIRYQPAEENANYSKPPREADPQEALDVSKRPLRGVNRGVDKGAPVEVNEDVLDAVKVLLQRIAEAR